MNLLNPKFLIPSAVAFVSLIAAFAVRQDLQLAAFLVIVGIGWAIVGSVFLHGKKVGR